MKKKNCLKIPVGFSDKKRVTAQQRHLSVTDKRIPTRYVVSRSSLSSSVRTWFRVKRNASAIFMDDTAQKNDPVYFGKSRQRLPFVGP